jgi:hypothetical protein
VIEKLSPNQVGLNQKSPRVVVVAAEVLLYNPNTGNGPLWPLDTGYFPYFHFQEQNIHYRLMYGRSKGANSTSGTTGRLR